MVNRGSECTVTCSEGFSGWLSAGFAPGLFPGRGAALWQSLALAGENESPAPSPGCGRMAAGPNTVPGCSLGHAQRATRPVLGWRGAAMSRQITTMDSVRYGCYNSNSEISALIYNKSISQKRTGGGLFMEQLSIFGEGLKFPLTYEDIDQLFKQYIYEGETDADVFTFSELKNGRSYFFYGQKVFEFVQGDNEHVRLKIMGDDKKTIVMKPSNTTSEELEGQLQTLKAKKHVIFRNLISDTFGCCNDFERCSDAKECIHKKDRFYNGCMYRTNLEAGRIFYGKNKNVGAEL